MRPRVMNFLAKLLPAPGSAVRRALLLAVFWGTGPVLKADTLVLPPPQDAEPNSPPEANPGLAEPGLTSRGVPSPEPPAEPPPMDVEGFYWRTHAFDNSALMLPQQPTISYDDPSLFRPVTTYRAPLGLQPKKYRWGLLEFYPWAGIAQSFDSNVQLVPDNQISDFYVTPDFGLEMQLGTPDSIYNEQYDTMFAAHLSYEGYADLFYEHPDLSAYNQKVDYYGRIGRDRLTVRPVAGFSDVTGSNLQLVELQNRAERLITTGGVVGEYEFTPVTSWRQTYAAFDFNHKDPTYVNYATWSTRQELTRLLPNDTLRALLWVGAQTTKPDKGFSGKEYFAGSGWQGYVTPRVYSELWAGWGALQLEGTVPGRNNLSGLRYGGYTTFDYNPSVRITLLYDRDYVFNEQTINDNYVVTLTQLKAEFLLREHWLVIPYLGCSVEDFETSHNLTLELRPELELSYVFAKEDYQIIGTADKSAGSRVFVKVGYDHSSALRGSSAAVQDVRISTGFNWNF